MKKHLFILIIFCISLSCLAQNEAPEKIYDEKADAMATLNNAISQAEKESKYVLCQVGGNWCPWCLRFAAFVESDSLIHETVYNNFVYVHVNWSRDNKNPEAMKFLGNPARFGFPVFVILDEKGKVIHIQNSAYLEENKGYSEKKVNDFLLMWTRQAVNTLK